MEIWICNKTLQARSTRSAVEPPPQSESDGLDTVVADTFKASLLDSGRIFDENVERELDVMLREQDRYEEMRGRHSKCECASEVVFHRRSGISGFDLPKPAHSDPDFGSKLPLCHSQPLAPLFNDPPRQDFDSIELIGIGSCREPAIQHAQRPQKRAPSTSLTSFPRRSYVQLRASNRIVPNSRVFRPRRCWRIIP